jgi:hypothetical protein
MIKIFREDTQWAIAGKVPITALEQLARRLPRDLQGDGSKVVEGKGGFAALLVFGDLPDETLAKQLLVHVTPVYLLDFDDDAPVTLKLERKHSHVTETRVNEHPADFLEGQGIAAPGYVLTPSPVKSVSLVEGVSLSEAKRAIPDAAVEFVEHPRGVLINYAPAGGMLAGKLGRRGYLVFHNPEDGWFSCILCEPDQEPASYSPVRPDPNFPPLSSIQGETTLEGILRVLEIPGEMLGLNVSGAADGR